MPGRREFTVSPRDSIESRWSAKGLFRGEADVLDYNLFDATMDIAQISERLALGGRVIASTTDYKQGRSPTSIGPQATIAARLAEDLNDGRRRVCAHQD